MPEYQGVTLEALEPLRILFGFFPTYRKVSTLRCWDDMRWANYKILFLSLSQSTCLWLLQACKRAVFLLLGGRCG